MTSSTESEVGALVTSILLSALCALQYFSNITSCPALEIGLQHRQLAAWVPEMHHPVQLQLETPYPKILYLAFAGLIARHKEVANTNLSMVAAYN